MVRKLIQPPIKRPVPPPPPKRKIPLAIKLAFPAVGAVERAADPKVQKALKAQLREVLRYEHALGKFLITPRRRRK